MITAGFLILQNVAPVFGICLFDDCKTCMFDLFVCKYFCFLVDNHFLFEANLLFVPADRFMYAVVVSGVQFMVLGIFAFRFIKKLDHLAFFWSAGTLAASILHVLASFMIKNMGLMLILEL